MNQKNYKESEKSFVNIIQKHKISYPLYIGYVNKGWHKILDNLFLDLIDNGWDRILLQVKEKFRLFKNIHWFC